MDARGRIPWIQREHEKDEGTARKRNKNSEEQEKIEETKKLLEQLKGKRTRMKEELELIEARIISLQTTTDLEKTNEGKQAEKIPW